MAVFVSAIMIMAMLAGCGGSGSGSGSSNVAEKIQSATNTSSSSDLDKVVSAIASSGFTASSIQAALINNGYDIDTDLFNITSGGVAEAVTITVGSDSDDRTIILDGIYIVSISATEDELLADVDDLNLTIDLYTDYYETQGYTVDNIYLALADAGDNQWILALDFVVIL